MRTFISVILFLGILTASAQADSLRAHCDGDSVHFTISSYGVVENPVGQSLNIRASIIGSCDPEFKLNPIPLDYPSYLQSIDFEVTLPSPSADRYVSYVLYREDPEGNAYPVLGSGDSLPYAYEACSTDAVFVRGKLWDYAGFTLEICEEHCWIDWPLYFGEADPGWTAFINTGQVVNLYGEAYVDGMPGGSVLNVSRVLAETNPEGCDAVAVEIESWGSIKARYR